MINQELTSNGKTYHLRTKTFENNDPSSALADLEHQRKIELTIDTSSYSSDTTRRIERQLSMVFYIKDGNTLIQCGVLNAFPLRQEISDTSCVEYVVSDILLYSAESGFFVIPECLGGNEFSNHPMFAVSPSIYYKRVGNDVFEILEYGKIYEPSDFSEIVAVQYIPHYIGRNRKRTEVVVYKNGRPFREIKEVENYCELPLEPEWFVFTKERNNSDFRRNYLLYNYMTGTEYPLYCYGGSGCVYNFQDTLATVLVDWNTEDKPLSDKEKIYFYISKNYNRAFEAVYACATSVGKIEIIPNVFPNDSTRNYKVSIPKREKDAIRFILAAIGKGKLYPKIFGCYVCDVVKALVPRRYDTPDNGYVIDELSTSRIIEYIRNYYPNIEDAQIVRLLASTYGNLALQQEHMQFWPYFHCEGVSPKWTSYSVERILGRKITSSFVKSLEKCSLDAKWQSEQLLFLLVSEYFADACFQYHDHWLEQQHLDIYIPSLQVAIEYQGQQHYEALDFFGGEEGFEYRMRMDTIKRERCQQNGVKLLEWSYATSINSINFIYAMHDIGIELE